MGVETFGGIFCVHKEDARKREGICLLYIEIVKSFALQ